MPFLPLRYLLRQCQCRFFWVMVAQLEPSLRMTDSDDGTWVISQEPRAAKAMPVLYQSRIPDLLRTGHVKGHLWTTCWARLAVIQSLVRWPAAALLGNTGFGALRRQRSCNRKTRFRVVSDKPTSPVHSNHSDLGRNTPAFT